MARAAFRERWLGRYLRDDPQFAYLAFDASGDVAGYVVGAIDDPVLSERFADVGYFAAFGDLTRKYPAHLHVNLAPAFRNRGIGGRLIEAFVAEAKRSGAPGVHVVTSANSDNVRFYNRNGFIEVARTKGSTSARLPCARASSQLSTPLPVPISLRLNLQAEAGKVSNA